MRIAIDFELVNTREGRMNPNARDAIAAWLAAGHTVEVYTTSEYVPIRDVADFLRNNGFAKNNGRLLVSGKPRWDVIAGKGTLDGAAPWNVIKSRVAKVGSEIAGKRAATQRNIARSNAAISSRMYEAAERDLARFKAKYVDTRAFVDYIER